MKCGKIIDWHVQVFFKFLLKIWPFWVLYEGFLGLFKYLNHEERSWPGIDLTYTTFFYSISYSFLGVVINSEEYDNVFDNETDENRVSLLVHNIIPPFLDGRIAYTCQTMPVIPVRIFGFF